MRWLGVGVAVVILFGIATALADGFWQPLAYMVGGSAVFAGIQLMHWLLVPRRVRRMLHQEPSLATPTRFVWDDQGLEAASDAGVSRLRWRELYRWFEGAHGFVFLLSDYKLLVLPARALSDEQASSLRAMLLARGSNPANGGAT